MRISRILVLIPLFLVSSLSASFELIRSSSPRGMALGNALVADPDPINGMLYNPALIAFSKAIKWQGVFSLDYLGFDTSTMNTFDSTFLFPFTYQFKADALFKGLVMGLSYNRFQLSDANSAYDANDNIFYWEQVGTISLGKKFENLFSYGTVLSVGLNFNLFNHGVAANDYTKNNTYFAGGLGATSFGLDLGATYFLGKTIVIGGMIENLLQPNMVINNQLAPQGDKVNMVYHLGVSWEIAKIAFMKNATLLAEYRAIVPAPTGNAQNDAILKNAFQEYHFGYEFWEFEKMLGVRLGYEWSAYNGGLGFSHLGVGLAFSKAIASHEFGVDVGWQYPLFLSDAGLGGTAGTLKFALNYSWSLPASSLEFDQKKREELKQLEDMRNKLLQEQKQTGNQEKQQETVVRKTGGDLAGDDPDAIMTKANADRNRDLLALFNDYTKKRDPITTSVDKLLKDYQPKMDDAKKKLDDAAKTLGAAKTPDEKKKAQDSITALTTARDSIQKEFDGKKKPFNDQLVALKKDTANKKSAIEKTYNDLFAKYKDKVTKNFKETPPSLNALDFTKDLSTNP